MQVAVSLGSTAFDEAPEAEAGPADVSGHTEAVSVPELIGFFAQAKSGSSGSRPRARPSR